MSALNTAMLNAGELNTFLLNGGDSAATSAQAAVEKYTLESRTKNGTLKAYLPAFWGGEWIDRLNAAGELRFFYDISDDAAAYLGSGYQIWLRDDTGEILQKFNIMRSAPTRDGRRTFVEVQAESILGQLRDEWIVGYSATDTVRNHLAAWVNNYQSGSLPIRLGSISAGYSSTSVAIEIDAKSIRDAFQLLYDAIGEGYFYVDPVSRRFSYKRRIGDCKGQRLSYSQNALGIVKTEDRTEMFTRLYLYGAGNGPVAALKLTDAGQPHDYMDQNTGTYGVITRVIIMKDIKAADTLLAVAQTLLDRFSVPRVTYEVSAVDLSNSNDGQDYSFERLRVGSRVTVEDEVLGIDVETNVFEIRRNLDMPLDVTVTLENKPRDLETLLKDIVNRIAVLEAAPVVLSDAAPPDVGTGTAGTSDVPARSDHTHGIDLADALVNDPAAEAAVEAVADSAITARLGSDIQSVGTANAAGTSSDIARVDHVHKGNHFSAASIGALPPLSEGNTWHTTSGTKYFGCYINGANDVLSHI